jgi:serine phosphatase RsbU (regulator of sigma subunit)
MREGYAAFSPGDGLVLFTDGVTDVGPSPDEFLDVAGIKATVRHLWARDVNQIRDGLLDEVVRRASHGLPDDATTVIVKFG